MSKTTRMLTVLAGATALGGLTYTIGRIAMRPRASHAAIARASARTARAVQRAANAEPWQNALRTSVSGSDALDRALDLDGLFDAEPLSEADVTVQLQGKLPHAASADDADPPGPDDLGKAWLEQATESEHSLREADLAPELENLSIGSSLDDVLDDDVIGDDDLGDLDDLDEHVRSISQRQG